MKDSGAPAKEHTPLLAQLPTGGQVSSSRGRQPALSPDHLPAPRAASPRAQLRSPSQRPSHPGPRLRPSQAANPRSVSQPPRKPEKKDRSNPFWWCLDPPSFSTEEYSDVWMNRKDRAGLVMAAVTLSLLFFADFVVIFIVSIGDWADIHAVLFTLVVALAVCSHLKVMFSDPGAVPRHALPVARGSPSQPETICGRCDAFKPTRAHHCRICGRCIVRMDHHCPWMNNCVGWANQKHFCLFLLYTCVASAYALALIAYTLIAGVELDDAGYVLIYAVVFLAFSAFLFTMSMILSQSHGILTGEGTVDRLQRRRKTKANLQPARRPGDFAPVPLKDIFGKYVLLWLLPVGPHFEDPNRVRGFRLPEEDDGSGIYSGMEEGMSVGPVSRQTQATYVDGTARTDTERVGAGAARSVADVGSAGGPGAGLTPQGSERKLYAAIPEAGAAAAAGEEGEERPSDPPMFYLPSEESKKQAAEGDRALRESSTKGAARRIDQLAGAPGSDEGGGEEGEEEEEGQAAAAGGTPMSRHGSTSHVSVASSTDTEGKKKRRRFPKIRTPRSLSRGGSKKSVDGEGDNL
mmetsp:Transcript_9638/g.15248  ORF Transcript_9638/g.15248 Transcript_9638/m.15248 type:complete len:576 (-) Transcript_9638:199-1926(-)